jgi:hypothetical protein
VKANFSLVEICHYISGVWLLYLRLITMGTWRSKQSSRGYLRVTFDKLFDAAGVQSEACPVAAPTEVTIPVDDVRTRRHIKVTSAWFKMKTLSAMALRGKPTW